MCIPLSHEKESRIPAKLISDLRGNNVIAWIGAGLSIGAGYPSWSGLVREIARDIDDGRWTDVNIQQWAEKEAGISPEWAAEVLRRADPHAFNESLKKQLDQRGPVDSITHALLALLPFKGYVTTNFDTLMEDALSGFTGYKPQVYRKNTAMDMFTDRSEKKFVYKIHGDLSDEDSIVLTESQFYGLQRDDIYNRVISWIFSKHTVMCMGYSLRDRDFRAMLDERYRIFQGNCPPIYAFVPSGGICKEEAECYSKQYNLQIVGIDPQNDFAELTSTLLSLYCLCHRIDSGFYGAEIAGLIRTRLDRGSARVEDMCRTPAMGEAFRLINTIKDPIELPEAVSILFDNNIKVTSAHIELLCSFHENNRIACADGIDHADDDSRRKIAKYLRKSFEVIPIDDNPRSLSVYYKGVMSRYVDTLSYLLKFKSSWDELVTDEHSLKRIIEYYRQQGMWKKWREIASQARTFVDDPTLLLQLKRSLAWIYFWVRDHDKLREIISTEPKINDASGVNNYTDKLRYIQADGLTELIGKLEPESGTGEMNPFDISMLGRAYARLSVLKPEQKDECLEKAAAYVGTALERATETQDLIEIAVQNWYLALILIDQDKLEEAAACLAETRRLDENIMERKPGIAWLRVAEYRLSKKKDGEHMIHRNKELARKAMDELGMTNIEEYLEREYFF